MSKVIVFEGFGDLESGWIFDMPIYMIKPVKIFSDSGGSIHHAETMIENYLIDLSWGNIPKSEILHKNITNQFYKARKGKAGKNIIYWKCEVIIDGSITDENSFTNGIIKQSEIKYFIKNRQVIDRSKTWVK